MTVTFVLWHKLPAEGDPRLLAVNPVGRMAILRARADAPAGPLLGVVVALVGRAEPITDNAMVHHLSSVVQGQTARGVLHAVEVAEAM